MFSRLPGDDGNKEVAVVVAAQRISLEMDRRVTREEWGRIHNDNEYAYCIFLGTFFFLL